jgi:hypothetical protein
MECPSLKCQPTNLPPLVPHDDDGLARLTDPYLNSDAGTMSPFEHGEVFVLDDGGEVR